MRIDDFDGEGGCITPDTIHGRQVPQSKEYQNHVGTVLRPENLQWKRERTGTCQEAVELCGKENIEALN